MTVVDGIIFEADTRATYTCHGSSLVVFRLPMDQSELNLEKYSVTSSLIISHICSLAQPIMLYKLSNNLLNASLQLIEVPLKMNIIIWGLFYLFMYTSLVSRISFNIKMTINQYYEFFLNPIALAPKTTFLDNIRLRIAHKVCKGGKHKIQKCPRET